MQFAVVKKDSMLGVVALLLLVTAQVASSASLLGRRDPRGPARTALGNSRTRRHTRGKNSAESYYPLLCPKVVCLPVARDCQEIEMIVFEYSRLYEGKMVDVRCESCEYCLDLPAGRRRRSLAELLGAKITCPEVSCPPVPSSCRDVRTTNIVLGGRRCTDTCPACFDGTVVAGNVVDL